MTEANNRTHTLVSGLAPLTDRVNIEPPILNGMTVSEAQIIGGASLLVYFLVGFAVFAVTGYWQAILVLTLFGSGCTLWLASSYLARIKRDRPDGFYGQKLHIWIADRGLRASRFITHHGYWELGRSLGLHLSADLAGDAPIVSSPAQPVKAAPENDLPRASILALRPTVSARTDAGWHAARPSVDFGLVQPQNP